MARALVNKNAAKTASINISDSPRTSQSDFSEQTTAETVGPETVSVSETSITSNNGEAITNPNQNVSQINKWTVMTTGDEGLKSALYNWINTTKDGVKVAPNLISGRSKKMTFNFYGNIGKSIAPGEIGEFNLIFTYLPQTATNTNGNTNTA